MTWDYIDTVTLHLDKTTMQAKFCILCRDYYAASQEKVVFQVRFFWHLRTFDLGLFPIQLH